MPKAKNYTGQVFGYLKAICFEHKYDKHRRRIWKWECVRCGNIVDRSVENVVRGTTKSCGCLRDSLIKHRGIDSVINQVFTQGVYAQCCYADGDMTFDQFKSLIFQPCHYCGKQPSNVCNGRNGIRIIYSGLDRIDNSKPHNFDNVVPCCRKHNTSKGELNYREYIEDMKKQLRHLGEI